MNIVVSPRFRREISLHVFENYNLPELRPSLILGIHGPAGEGKSCQCAAVFDELRLTVHNVPMTRFESNFAGDPAENIEKAFNDCVKEKLTGLNPVILIEDFDAAVGDFGAQYTVNTQHVLGTLMGLAERVLERPSERVPIVVTGNDFVKLYGPLTRSGRMRLFKWEATVPEKACVVQQLFPKLGSRANELITVCNKRCEEIGLAAAPISLYSEVRARLADDIVYQELVDGFSMFPHIEERNSMAQNTLALLNAKEFDEIHNAIMLELERRANGLVSSL